MKSVGEDRETNYVELDQVRQEIQRARKLFTKFRWPVIDVTRRSIEETASEIFALYAANLEKQSAGEPPAKTSPTS